MIFYGIVGLLLIVSLLADRRKTLEAIKIAWGKFKGILPMFSMMLVLVSVSLFLLPESVIREYLGEQDTTRGLTIALLVGSVSFMPGFIVFPLCGILRTKGVPFTVISGFTTTLMMVGIVTLPLEKKYFGMKLALTRNLTSFVIAVVVAVLTGIAFGEVTL